MCSLMGKWSLCFLAKRSLFFFLASLISVFPKATQLFSSHALRSIGTAHVEMLSFSLLNISMSSAGYFVKYVFARTFLWPHLFLEDDGSPLSFQALIWCWIVNFGNFQFSPWLLCFLDAITWPVWNQITSSPRTTACLPKLCLKE